MITLAALTGFMLGSLNKIWPWKRTLETYIDRHDVVRPLTQLNVLPQNYDGDPQILAAILLVIFGFAIIFIIEFIAKKLAK